MTNALKRLWKRSRERWRLHQARSAIARCNRRLASRSRIGVPLPIARPTPRPFAPGVIDMPPPRRIVWFPYALVLMVGVVGFAVLLGVWA